MVSIIKVFFPIEWFLIICILSDYSALIRSLLSVPGHFGEYLLFEVFETAVRFKMTALMHRLRESFPEKGDHLFKVYNLPMSTDKMPKVKAESNNS